MITELSRRQILACANTLYLLPEPGPALLEFENWLFSGPKAARLEKWYVRFTEDLHESRKGYPLKAVHHTPALEDALGEILQAAPAALQPVISVPTLCLSHDIDYLQTTLQMRLKRLVGYRKLILQTSDYLSSLRVMLEREAQIIGNKGTTTIFVACPEKLRHPQRRLTQWLIDPSYQVSQKGFKRLVELLNEFECEIGLHGSFLSLEQRLLSRERTKLSLGANAPVTAGRQHWLNLPPGNAFEQIAESGIHCDSTLGWNGDYGFRGGFSRPFPIALSNGRTLWELPLVLMDGPLFEDLQLSGSQVFDRSVELLEQVHQRKGCVSINWHDRAADPQYGWFETYEKIVLWAKEKGFQFKTFSDAMNPHERGHHV